MTSPRRWPQNAERARVETLAAGREIRNHCTEARNALVTGNRDLAAAHIADIRTIATEIVMAMRLAKEGS